MTAPDDPRQAHWSEGPEPAWASTIAGADEEATERPVPPGPPGGRIFSLDDRPAPALYLLAWLLSVGGLAVLLVTTQAEPSLARSLVILASMLAILLGLAAGAGYQLVARADRDAAWYRGPSPPLTFGIVLALSSLAALLLGAAGGRDPSATPAPFAFLLDIAVVGGTYTLVVWLLVVRSGALRWADMGWPVAGGNRLRRSLRAAAVGALVMVPTTLAALMLGGIVASILRVEAPQVVPTAATSAEALAVALAAVALAPVGEDLFFRGFALTAWARDLPERSALVRSAVFFAVVHIAVIRSTSFGEGAAQAVLQVSVILPLGLVLGWLFLRRGIMASIAGHVTYNGLLLALQLLTAGRIGGA